MNASNLGAVLERAAARPSSTYLPVVSIVIAAIGLRATSHLCSDVSWLLTLAERMLSGQRPYIDFVEVNPPASILLYYPAALIGHALGVRPEPIVEIMVFAAACASLIFCATLIRKTGHVQQSEIGRLGAATAFTLLILPFYIFAQREHFALIAILPILCVYIARATGRETSDGSALAAGLAAGVAIVIKPHFVLALALPFSYVIWRRRHSPDVHRLGVVPENLAACALALAYAVFAFWKYPAFFSNELPVLRAVYLPVRLSLVSFLLTPSCLLFGAGALMTLRFGGNRIREPFSAIPLLSAVGFALAAAIQGKGWLYHMYPAVALVLLVLGNLFSRARDPQAVPIQIVLFALLVFATCSWFSRNAESPEVQEALQRMGIPHPKVLMISGDLNLGHPMTREIGGSWAGTACSMWVTENANYLLSRGGLGKDTVSALNQYKAQDRALILRDIGRNKPDIVLIGDHNWRKLAMSYAPLRAALGRYHNEQTVDGVEIWLRNSRSLFRGIAGTRGRAGS